MVTRYLSCGLLSISGLTAPLPSRESRSYFGSVYTALFIQLCSCLLAANASVFALEQTISSSLFPPLKQLVFGYKPLHQIRPLQKFQKVIHSNILHLLFLACSRKCNKDLGAPFLIHHSLLAGSGSGFFWGFWPENALCCKEETAATALCWEAGIHWNMQGRRTGASHLYESYRKTYIFINVCV